MNARIFHSHIVFFIAGLVFSPAFLYGQRIGWARQLYAEGGKAEITGFTLDGLTLRLDVKSDNNLIAGKKSFRKKSQAEFFPLLISPEGEISQSETDGLASAEDSAPEKKTRMRNGNYFLAYGRTSALVPPGKPEWNLCYLDGNQKRLWDIPLDSAVQVQDILLLANGNCLLGGYEFIARGNLDLWLALYDTKGSLRWKKRSGGRRSDEILALSEDSEGRIFAAGYCSPDSSFLGNSDDLSGKDPDGFISCFDQSGNEKFFYRQRGKGLCRVEKIGCRPDGKLLFAATISGSDWKLPPFGFARKGLLDVVIGVIDPVQGKEKENPLRIFPNPAREIVYFSLDKPVIRGKARAILQQKDGTVLQEMTINPEPGLSYRFNVSNTKPGPYIILIKDGSKEVKERLLVE